MTIASPASLCRAIFRDGALDLALALYLLLNGGFAFVARTSFLTLTISWLTASILFSQLRRRVFIPRAGYVRLREWRLYLPILVLSLLLGFGSLVGVFWEGGPVRPGSLLDRSTVEVFHGALILVLLGTALTLKLRRFLVYTVCALGALLALSRGLHPGIAMSLIALPVLGAGITLMVRFMKEPHHVEA